MELDQTLVGENSGNPIAVVNMDNKYSVLRAYNQGVSNKFIEENKDILTGVGSREERWKRMDERMKEGRRERAECTKALNESWERIEAFDREYFKRRNRIYKWFMGSLFGILGIYLLSVYLSKPKIEVNVPLVNHGLIGNLISHGKKTIISLLMIILFLLILPYLLKLFILLIIKRLFDTFKEIYYSFKQEVEDHKRPDDKKEK